MKAKLRYGPKPMVEAKITRRGIRKMGYFKHPMDPPRYLPGHKTVLVHMDPDELHFAINNEPIYLELPQEGHLPYYRELLRFLKGIGLEMREWAKTRLGEWKEQSCHKYGARLLKVMENIRLALIEGDVLDVGLVFKMEEGRWELCVGPEDEDDDDEDDIDISLEVLDSVECDGSIGGLNLGLSVVTRGGRIIGGLVPHNYSPEVWTMDLEHRVRMFEGMDWGELVSQVRKERQQC